MDGWHGFAVVAGVQILFLLFVAFLKRDALSGSLSRAVFTSMALGVVFGTAFDMFFGGYLQIFGYFLPTSGVFLMLNGGLSYGAMIATVYLLQRESFWRFYAWTIAVAMVYETANYFFPLWYWTFSESMFVHELVVVFAAYFGLACMMAGMLMLTTRAKFMFFAR